MGKRVGVESLGSVVPANRVDTCGWMEGIEVVRVAGKRGSVIEGTVNGVTARHRSTFT